MSKSLPFLTLLIMLFQACSPDSSPTPTSDPKENQYYDLKSYFEEEVDRLNQSAPSVVKTVTLNDDEEQKETEIADFSKELLIFSESHINKVSWWGKYAGDTSYYQNGQISTIIYTAGEEELKTKSVRISFSISGEIDSLFILNSTDNPTISTYQELIYLPNKKYEIFSQEKVALSKDRKLRIEGVFSK
jgi:hypothetical protein